MHTFKAALLASALALAGCQSQVVTIDPVDAKKLSLELARLENYTAAANLRLASTKAARAGLSSVQMNRVHRASFDVGQATACLSGNRMLSPEWPAVYAYERDDAVECYRHLRHATIALRTFASFRHTQYTVAEWQAILRLDARMSGFDLVTVPGWSRNGEDIGGDMLEAVDAAGDMAREVLE